MTNSLCDKQLIWIVAGIVIVALAAAFTLEYSGHAGASAAFVGVAMGALGILSPSPLKQHNQGGSGDTSVDASKADNVTVNNPPAVPADPAEPVAP